MSSYADNFHVASTSSDVDSISDNLGAAIQDVEDWTAENGMEILGPKSTITLFTPWRAQFGHHPSVSVGGVAVPLVRNPRLLGVILDPSFT